MLFQPSSFQGKTLRRYVDQGVYELAIDDGRQSLEIANEDVWSSIECGTTVFMSLALLQAGHKARWHECPVCFVKNHLRNSSENFITDWYAVILPIADASTYLLIAGIVTGDCTGKIILILALTACG